MPSTCIGSRLTAKPFKAQTSSRSTSSCRALTVQGAASQSASLPVTAATVEQQLNNVKATLLEQASKVQDIEMPTTSDLTSAVETLQSSATGMVVEAAKPFDVFSGQWTLDFLFVAIILLLSYSLIVAAPRQ